MRSDSSRHFHILAAVLILVLAACSVESPQHAKPKVPRGYSAVLHILVNGQQLGLGPFVGYYFRPKDPTDLSHLTFVCFNEQQFYTKNLPDGAQLYEGEAIQVTLPSDGILPEPAAERIHPVFEKDIPKAWLSTRPFPQDEFIHFHSCYNAVGPVLTGYWIRHVAVASFTYDMGGRVGAGSILYHQVSPGPDRAFAKIVEFDAGPVQ